MEPTPETAATLEAHASVMMERLNAAIEHVGAWVERSEAFATEQVPLLVKEIILWGIAEPALYIFFGLSFLVVAYMAKRIGTQRWKEWDDRGDAGDFCQAVVCVVGIVGALGGVALIFTNVLAAAQPLLAPRLYLIEYFQQLVK